MSNYDKRLAVLALMAYASTAALEPDVLHDVQVLTQRLLTELCRAGGRPE